MEERRRNDGGVAEEWQRGGGGGSATLKLTRRDELLVHYREGWTFRNSDPGRYCHNIALCSGHCIDFDICDRAGRFFSLFPLHTKGW